MGGIPTTSLSPSLQVWSGPLRRAAHIPGNSPTQPQLGWVLSQGSPRQRPASHPCPISRRSSPHFHILVPIQPFTPSKLPSHSLDGMKHRQTHPRARQLVRAETVTEREGERDGRDASSAETETERPGEMEREAETRVGVEMAMRGGGLTWGDVGVRQGSLEGNSF